MKTIQQYFREANADELANGYLFAHPISIDPSTTVSPDLTISDAYNHMRERILGLIERIRTVEVTPDSDDWVFFVHHIPEHDGENTAVAYAKVKDVLDTDNCVESYAYEFSPIAETAGALVADTYLTMRNLDDILLDYLFESSFFGFEQESLPDAIAQLDEALTDSDLRPMSELYDELGWEPEKHDTDERAAWHELIEAEATYSKTAKMIEQHKVAELLRESNSTDSTN